MRFIRHGQSAFNLHFNTHGRDPGIADAPLTPHGLKQAQAAAEQLAGQGIAAIVSSPYTRALQTAHAIADVLKLDIVAEPMAGEKRLYSCDIGTPAARLRADWPKVDFTALTDDHWWRPGEPLDGRAGEVKTPSLGKPETDYDVRRRLDAFHAKWQPHAAADNLLIVSHWYFIYAATGRDAANAEIIRLPSTPR